MAEFKKHMMYGDGKSKMANTKKEHLNLKAKGWGHTKPKSGSPLEINQALVAGARGSNYQYGGETSLSAGEWKGNLMTQPIMNALVGKQLTAEEQKNTNTNNKNTNNKNNNANDKKKEIVVDDKKVKPADNGLFNDDSEKIDGEKIDSEKIDGDGGDDGVDIKNSKNKKAPKKVTVDYARGNFLNRIFNPKGYSDGKKYQHDKVTREALQKDYYNAKNVARDYLKNNKGASKKDENGELVDKEYAKLLQQSKDIQTNRSKKMYRVKKKGLFNDKTYNEEDLKKYLDANELTKNNRYNTEYQRNLKPGKYYSPLDMNSRENILRPRFKRKNAQGSSPYAYKERINDNTPFYQVEDYDPSTQEQEAPMQKVELPGVLVEGNVFDLMQRIGPIDSKEWVAGAAFIGDEKPPQLLGSSAILGITNFMKTQKNALDEIKKVKGADSDGLAIINNVRALSTNMNKVGTFFSENIDAIDQENESKGSSVANSYLRDIVLTQKTDEEGKPLTTMMVDNNNELAIKFMGTKGVHSLKSIKKDVFPKAYDSFEMLAKGMSTMKSEATSGAPFNKEGAMALINNAIKTEQQILSSIHDEESPLYNFLNDFAEQYPNANGDFAIIDSPSYSLEDLEPLVKDYALMKLKAQHTLYSKSTGNASQLTAEQIIKKYS
mgnify:CR=1 FL=1|tara:strand:+ start:1110 stop:3095 length:1986 start_codon:yes stop_codon:yes gene_type:complete